MKSTNIYDNIPTELKDLRRWVNFKLVSIPGQERIDKPPFQPTGAGAMANNPATWSTYEECVAAFRNPANNFDGIGLEIAEPFVGIDLDNCRNPETGEIEPWAQDIIDALDSYTEISPSGSGIHIIIRGALPPGWRKNKTLGIEVYDRGRYLTTTGQRVEGTPVTINERQEELAEIHLMLGPIERTQPARPSFAANRSFKLTDDQILLRASKAGNRDKFNALFRGEWKGMGYRSRSEVDIALCQTLLFWADDDELQVDRLFQQSGLMRKKWLRTYYRNYSVAVARKVLSSTYSSLMVAGGQSDLTERPLTDKWVSRSRSPRKRGNSNQEATK